MKLNFDYKGTKVTYNLTYKKTRTISINVKGGKVDVIAPLGTSVYAVMDKVKGNAPWIINELYGNVPAEPQVKLLEQYTYLGKNYKLEVVSNGETDQIKVKMVRGKFVVETNTDSTEQIRAAIIAWYKNKVEAKVKERLKVYKESFKIIPTDIQVIDSESILFQTREQSMTINVRAGILPAEVIDYIIVSGLTRINCTQEEEEAKLNEVLPNAQKSKEWLAENKNKLTL